MLEELIVKSGVNLDIAKKMVDGLYGNIQTGSSINRQLGSSGELGFNGQPKTLGFKPKDEHRILGKRILRAEVGDFHFPGNMNVGMDEYYSENGHYPLHIKTRAASRLG